MLGFYDKDVINFDMWGAWSLDGIGAVEKKVRGWFEWLGTDRDRVEFEIVRAVPGSDLAMAQAYISFAAINPAGEVLRSMDNRLTWVAAPKDGKWQIIHEHTSSPVSPDNAGVIFKR